MVNERCSESKSAWIDAVDFGVTQAGQDVKRFIFGNGNDCEVEMLTYGATVHSVKTPDRDGKIANINLGCEDLSGYESNEAFLGATVGPFCNRIGGASFEIDGRLYQLTANDGPNMLHGGKFGFHQKVWAAEMIEASPSSGSVGVKFSTTSPDGEDGFPGTVEVAVTYLLNEQNELWIEFTASTDKATHVNLTNHCYWNLSGISGISQSTIDDHLLQINADNILDVDDAGIPTGKLTSVAKTPFDFNQFKLVGSDMKQLNNTPQGYDHSYIIRHSRDSKAPNFKASKSKASNSAATLVHPASGRCVEILTDQPALQFYTANSMNGQLSSGGHPQHAGIALETQGFPDAPNHDHFPSTLLLPTQEFKSKTVIKFSAQK